MSAIDLEFGDWVMVTMADGSVYQDRLKNVIQTPLGPVYQITKVKDFLPFGTRVVFVKKYQGYVSPFEHPGPRE
jgi:hypothetical protein